MSQITKIALCCLLIVGGLISAIGCGSSKSNSNANATFDSDTQQHPSGWLPAGHMVDAATGTTRTDVSECAECHGENYKGGIAGVSCTQCHIGDELHVHPTAWTTPKSHSTNSTASSTASCANVYCHGADLSGVTGSGLSCTSCHMGGVYSAHPLAWNGNASTNHRDYVLQNPGNLAYCSNAKCHGTNFLGVTGSGPSCVSCHSEPFYNCTACHGQPPDTGKHVFHVSKQQLTCVNCHQLTSALHDNGTVNLVTSITYSFTSKSCTPSCHDTETWQ